MPENMRTASAEHFDALRSWNTLERRPRHCTLDFHTKVQVWGQSLSVSLQSSRHPKEYPCFKKVLDLACSKKREVEKRGKERKKGRERKKKKKKRQREKRKREKGRRKECGRAMAPHTQAARAHKQSRTLLLFLSKPLLLHSDRHLLTCTKGDVPCVPNHKALCQRSCL